MGGVEPDRCQHRHYFPDEEVADPGPLLVAPQAAADEGDALLFQRGEDDVVEQCVLVGNQPVGLLGDAMEYFERGNAIGADGVAAEFYLLLEAGNADFEEFVEIGRDDAQEA